MFVSRADTFPKLKTGGGTVSCLGFGINNGMLVKTRYYLPRYPYTASFRRYSRSMAAFLLSPLVELRALLAEQGVEAFLIGSGDAHQVTISHSSAS